jgi:hypothetical protein
MNYGFSDAMEDVLARNRNGDYESADIGRWMPTRRRPDQDSYL